MGIKNFFLNLMTGKSEDTTADKQTYIQDYEKNRWFVDWAGITRSDGLIDYRNYKAAYQKHSTVVRCIQYRAKSILQNGFIFEPVPNAANPKQSNYDALVEVFRNLDPDNVKSAYEILFSSFCDWLRDGIKPIQIDMGDYPYLYDTLEIGTLQPRIHDNGLFKNDGQGHWVQVIDGRKVDRLFNDELIWLRMPDSTKLIYPQSPLEPLLVDIETDILGREFSYQRFANASNLGMVYVLPESTNESQAKTYLQFIKKNYISKKTGFGQTNQKAAKPIVLYGGTTVAGDLAKDFGDFQFIKLNEVTDKKICIAYEIPPRLLGYETGGMGQTGANIEALAQFYQNTTWPDQKILEEQINKQYIQNRLGIHDWVIKFPRPVAKDAKTEVTNRNILVRAGIETVTEARSGLRGIYPELVEDNDSVAQANSDKILFSKQQTSQPEQKSFNISGKKAINPKKKKKFDHKRVKKEMQKQEDSLRGSTAKSVAKIAEAAKKKLPGLVVKNKYKDIQSYSVPYKNEVKDNFVKNGVGTFKAGQNLFKEIAGKKAMKLSDYEKLVRVEGLQSGENYVLSLEKAIKTDVLAAVSRQLSENDVIGIIDKAINRQVSINDATFRTVTTKFYNEALLKEAYENRDFVKRMQFSAILDNRTSDRCERLDGAIVAVDSPEFDKITPPLHFNCRSMWVPITEDDIEQNPGSYDVSPSKEVNRIVAATPGFEV